MEYTRLGNSGAKVSRIGFGCCPLGGHGWGEYPIDQAQRAVSIALDVGINLFDTADIYGMGASESRLGNALFGRRHEAFIATKYGVRISPQGKTYYDISTRWLEQALDQSLKRLRTDYIDLYQIHYPDSATHLADVIECLEKKMSEGKILNYGVSNFKESDFKNITPNCKIITNQLEYSLANRSNELAIKGFHASRSLKILTWGSLGQGVLTGKYDDTTRFPDSDRRSRSVYKNFHGSKLNENMLKLNVLRRLSVGLGKTPAQIALRWILDRFDHTIALVGIKNACQLKENSGAFGWRITPECMARLNDVSNREII